MKKLFLIFATYFYIYIAMAQRVEPAFWWVNMKEPSLQLLVHQEDIGTAQPSFDYAGVKLAKVTRVKSPNYLFIDLIITPQAKAGKFPIKFSKNGKTVFSYDYELKNREPNSALRQGFTSADAMYLIAPDRFANANPANDNVPGMPDLVERNGKDKRHGGDIQGITEHLNYIRDLGFSSLWICPLQENNQKMGSYHGYAMTDLYKIDPRFGSNEDYRNLSKEAQKRGIKLVLDWVPNHCGSEHWWMSDLPTDDWLNFQQNIQITHHARESVQDPHASEYDKELHASGWFVTSMPDLNQRNPLMANYLIQNSIWWIEYADLHGIRVDTYPYSDKDFMARWSQRVMSEYPNFNMVGEEWSANPAIVAFWQRGKKNANGYVSSMPTMFDFPLQMALIDALNDDDKIYNTGLTKLYQTLSQDFLYPNAAQLVVMADNHDITRFYSQIHENFDLWKMGLTFICTTRGLPQIYYGTEVLMTSPMAKNDDLIRKEMPGGWPDHTTSAFTEKGLTPQQIEAKRFLTKLLQWRKATPAVQTGQLKHFAARDGLYVYFRYNDKQKVMVVMNKNKEPLELDLNKYAEMLKNAKSAKNVVTGETTSLADGLTVAATTAMILEIK